MTVYYAQEAAAEVDRLLSYIAERSPSGARRVAEGIKAAERTLSDYPGIGQLTSTRRMRLRRFVLNPYPYVIFYAVSGDDVLIAAVRHTARDPSTTPDFE